MKKRSYLFLFSLIIIVLVCVGLLKNNSYVVKSDYSKLKLVITGENVVDRDLIDYLSSVNGKASLFTQSKKVSYVENSSKKNKKIDVNVKVNAKDNAFPKDTEIKVESVSVDKNKVEKTIKDYSNKMKVNGLYAVDISFYSNGEEQQPRDDVLLSIELPEELDYSDSNALVLLHFAKDGIEVVGQTSIEENKDRRQISFKVDSFSTYAVVLVNSQYPSTLMRDLLVDDETYEIVTFKTNLFNYDPRYFNQAGSGERLMFRGYGNALEEEDGVAGTNGINNATSTYAKQGIVEDTLDSNGMPVINYSTVSGDAFFNPNTWYNGKTVYKDVDFEFLYNKNTGYYEYKSTVNHAQFNETTNKIELYADTMAPLNYVNSTVTLTDYSTDIVDINSANINNATGELIATSVDKNGDGNVIPEITFDSGIASKYAKRIIIKAYFPQIANSNTFKLYFITDDETIENHDVYNEEKSFTVNYEGNNNWDLYELVIDTSDNELWAKNYLSNITGIKIVPFEVYDTNSSYDFVIQSISYMEDFPTSYTYSGFYPFSKIENSYTGNGERFNIDDWKTRLEDSSIIEVPSSRSVYNAKTRPDREYLHFGLTTEFEFYMPPTRTIDGSVDDESTTTDNLRFEFTGDDDLWVFVDDKLVLDIGGGHGAINGYIDFTSNEVYVSNAVTVTGYDETTATEEAAPVTATIDESILAEGKHTVKIFYMERAGAASNNLIKFNLPQTPLGDLIVSKEALEDRGRTDLFNGVNYQFTIEENGTLIDGLEYKVMGDGIDTLEARTLSNGEFTLQNGQFAIFPIAEDKEITVTETYSKIGSFNNYYTSINDEKTKTLTQTTEYDVQTEFNVVNKYRENRDDLVYVVVIDPSYTGSDNGVVTLNGTDTSSTESVKETLEVLSGQAVGSTASTTGSSLKFVGWYADEDCTQLLSTDPNYIPPKPAKGYNDISYYAYFEPNAGDLTIQKRIDDDYFFESKFLFRIVGTDNDTKNINMLVSLVGNSSVTIKDLPVGNYTITEDTNWNWRYTVSNSSSMNITLQKGENNVTFENNLINEKWISFDTNAINSFSY